MRCAPKPRLAKGHLFLLKYLIESQYIGDMLTFRFTNSTCALQNSFYLPRAHRQLTLPHIISTFMEGTILLQSGSQMLG
jgi:hypothetical protein